jgi:hypothetical protein
VVLVTKSALADTGDQEVLMSAQVLRTILVLATMGATFPAVALAQPQGPPTSRVEGRAMQLPGGQVARLVVRWGTTAEACSARFAVGTAAPETIYAGPAAATLAVGHKVLVIAYAVDEERGPFRVRAAPLDGAGPRLGPGVQIERPQGAARGMPFAVVATSTPDGFAVFFQEVETDDPTAAHTYLVRLDGDGDPSGPATEVNVPWSLADAIWNGAGFHLALFYPGDGSGMRLSMVSLSADGSPQQHPDWASAAGYIADVHLVSTGGRIRAFYRGGAAGDRVLESDVTAIRSWGNEPPAARAHGSIGSSDVIVLAIDGDQVQPRPVEIE